MKTKIDFIKETLKEVETSSLVGIYNEYAEENEYEERFYDIELFDEFYCNLKPSQVMELVYNPLKWYEAKYFCEDYRGAVLHDEESATDEITTYYLVELTEFIYEGNLRDNSLRDEVDTLLFSHFIEWFCENYRYASANDLREALDIVCFGDLVCEDWTEVADDIIEYLDTRKN